jgi:hypothetical protein
VAKYAVGEIVRCVREGDFDFVGEVTKVSRVDEDSVEYAVTNAPRAWPGGLPLLVWEDEIKGVNVPTRT